MVELGGIAKEAFCYLTTRGRITHDPHEIEIWFGAKGSTIYMLSGGGVRSDWVKNLLADPRVRVRIGAEEFEGRGRLVDDPAEVKWVRSALFDKYDAGYGGDLTEWSRSALPVAVDITQ